MSALDQAVLRDAVLHTEPRPLRRRPEAPVQSPPRQIASAEPEPGLDHDAAVQLRCDDGFRAGFAAGMQEAERRVDEAIAAARIEADVAAQQTEGKRQAAHAEITARLQSLCGAFRDAAAERLQALELDAVELAFAAVCKVIGEQPETMARVEGAVRVAINALQGAKLLSIRVHPSDLELLGTGCSLMRDLGDVEWAADRTIEPGGCMLDADRGSIDARLLTQLEHLRSHWAEALHVQAPPPHLARAA